MPAKREREPLATTNEVAEYLGVSVPTLKRWRRDGTGPPWRRVGRWIRYDMADVANPATWPENQPAQPRRTRSRRDLRPA